MANANPTSPASDPYVLVRGEDAACTHLVDEVQLCPADVVRRFGPGEEGDGYKVSRRWVFRRGGLVFTLYDWKSTYLYDVELWTPEQLWESPWPWDLHVGSKAPTTKADVAEFVAYLYRATSETSPAPLRPSAHSPWTAETWAAAQADSLWADERWAARMRERFLRYPSLRLEEKIRLAMAILYDVDDSWDHDGLVHYPDELPSFDEYLSDIGSRLYAIRWK
jgi:hypothetical protein